MSPSPSDPRRRRARVLRGILREWKETPGRLDRQPPAQPPAPRALVRRLRGLEGLAPPRHDPAGGARPAGPGPPGPPDARPAVPPAAPSRGHAVAALPRWAARARFAGRRGAGGDRE